MKVNLSKNQVINLSKSTSSKLNSVMVGLGWDPAKEECNKPAAVKPSLMSRLFGASNETKVGKVKPRAIDCDAFCVALNNSNKLIDVIYFGNPMGLSGSIHHTGDNLTGEGDGDDEQIIINLCSLPDEVAKIVLAVNVYMGIKRMQHFGMIDNAFIRIVNRDNNAEMCNYSLSGQAYSGKVTVVFGELHKNSAGDWEFKAIGEPDEAECIGDFCKKFK